MYGLMIPALVLAVYASSGVLGGLLTAALIGHSPLHVAAGSVAGCMACNVAMATFGRWAQ